MVQQAGYWDGLLDRCGSGLTAGIALALFGLVELLTLPARSMEVQIAQLNALGSIWPGAATVMVGGGVVVWALLRAARLRH